MSYKMTAAGSLLVVSLLAGCVVEETAEESSSAAVRPGEGELPPGHPPLDAQGRARLVWQVPEGWIVEPPETNMRVAQYRVPGTGGEGRCVVFYFGAGEGGDPAANARRWASQFEQPDGTPSVESMIVTPVDSAVVPVQLVEITGVYDGGMAMSERPAQPQPDHMLLGGIVQGPDAPWFFKLTGPEATVHPQREAFVRMLESIRPED
jgi:hypothetical protein